MSICKPIAENMLLTKIASGVGVRAGGRCLVIAPNSLTEFLMRVLLGRIRSREHTFRRSGRPMTNALSYSRAVFGAVFGAMMLGTGISFLATVAAADDGAPKVETAAPDDPAARAILERAIRAQNGARLENTIVDVRGTFEVTTREDGHKLEADVVQAYLTRDRKEYYLSSVRDRTQKKTVTKGFDGRDYWLRDGERGRLLRSRDDRADRTSIDREIDDLKRNLRYLFLANLKGDANLKGNNVRFVMAPGSSDAPEGTVAIRRIAPDERDVILFFSETTSHLVRVVMPAVGEEPKVRIDFFAPKRKPKPERCRKVFVEDKLAEDLWVPRQIVIYEGAAKDPLHDFFFNEIRINSSLEPEIFALDGKSSP